jgi:hypothetical protein
MAIRIPRYDSSISTFSETFELKYPQLAHARCGSLACPHFGHAVMFMGLRA